MTRYVWRKGLGVIEAASAPPRRSAPYVQSDITPFKSPLEGHKLIEGRAQLREELNRNNCRIADPSEWHGGRPHYINPSFTKKRNLPLY